MKIHWIGQGFKADWGKGKILRQESDCVSEDPKEGSSYWRAARW